MEVAVGSKRGPKVNAVRAAFTDAFAPMTIEVTGYDVDSGVSSHPISPEETLTGAINRVRAARLLQPKADYFVGIEGGLQSFHLNYLDVSLEVDFVVVENVAGKQGFASNSGFQLSGVILKDILSGKELSEVMSGRWGIDKIGSANGFSGLATNELVTREETYYDAVAHALGPFLNPQFFA